MGILDDVEKAKQQQPTPSLTSEDSTGIMADVTGTKADDPSALWKATQFGAEALNSATLGASGLMEKGLRSLFGMDTVEEARSALGTDAQTFARGVGNVGGALVPIGAASGILGNTARLGAEQAFKRIAPQIDNWLGRNIAAPAAGGAAAATSTSLGSSSGIDQTAEQLPEIVGGGALMGPIGNAIGRGMLSTFDKARSHIPFVGRDKSDPITKAYTKRDFLTPDETGQTELGKAANSPDPVTVDTLMSRVQKAPVSEVVGDVIKGPEGARTGSALTARQAARPSSKDLTGDLERTIDDPKYNRDIHSKRKGKDAANAMFPTRASAPTYNKTKYESDLVKARKPLGQELNKWITKNERTKVPTGPIVSNITKGFTVDDNLDAAGAALIARIESVTDEAGNISLANLHKIKQEVGGIITQDHPNKKIVKKRAENASASLYQLINSTIRKKSPQGSDYARINSELSKLSENDKWVQQGYKKIGTMSPKEFKSWYDGLTQTQKTQVKNGSLMRYHSDIGPKTQPEKYLEGKSDKANRTLENLKAIGVDTKTATSLASEVRTDREVTKNYQQALTSRARRGAYEQESIPGQINPVAASLSAGLSLGQSRVPTVGERSQMLRAGRDMLGMTSAEDDALVSLLTAKAGRHNRGESELFDLMNVDDILTRRANRAGASGSVRAGAASSTVTDHPTKRKKKKKKEED